jgi:hypothetical protein
MKRLVELDMLRGFLPLLMISGHSPSPLRRKILKGPNQRAMAGEPPPYSALTRTGNGQARACALRSRCMGLYRRLRVSFGGPQPMPS